MPQRRRTSAQDAQQRSLNTKRTGDILREARERNGQTLEQVSQAIHIRPSMLEAIEAGQFYGLTDPLYLKGFIRAYAKHVGLNESEVLPFFRREYDEQEHQQQLTQPLAPIEPKKSRISPGWLVVGFLTLAILLVGAYSYRQYVSVALNPKLELESPQDQFVAESGQVDVRGQTDPDATLTLNGQEILLAPNGSFSLSVSLAAGANTLQFQAVNRLGKRTEVTRTVTGPAFLTQATVTPTPPVLASASASLAELPPSSTASAMPELQSSPSASPTPVQRTTLTVVAGPASAWLDVTAGQQKFAGLLLPGASKTFTGSTIRLKTGNGGSTRLILNGVDQGLMGEDKQVIERTYGVDE